MTCPTCGAGVVVGELHRGGHALIACFEEVATSSAYLALPQRVTQLATVFVPSEFGAFRMHHCCNGAGGAQFLDVDGEWGVAGTCVSSRATGARRV